MQEQSENLQVPTDSTVADVPKTLIEELPLEFSRNSLTGIIQKFTKSKDVYLLIESGTISTRLSTIKAYRALEDIAPEKFELHHLEKYEAVLDEFIEQYRNNDTGNTFIIDCGGLTNLKEFVGKIAATKDAKKIIFIAKNKCIVQSSAGKFYKIHQDSNHFQQLTPAAREFVMNHVVYFQGHAVKLDNLVSLSYAETALDDICLNELFDKSEFKIDDDIPIELPAAFIPRKLYRNVPCFDNKIAKDPSIVVLKDRGEFDEKIKDPENMNKYILLVDDYKDGKLLWKKACSTYTPPKLYTVRVEATIKDIVEDKNAVIVGEMGSGKSTLLASMLTHLKNENPEKWIYLINAQDLQHFSSNIFTPSKDDKDNYAVFIEYLLEFVLVLKTQFERSLFAHISSKQHQLMLIVDDMEHLCPIQYMFVIFLRESPIDFIACTANIDDEGNVEGLCSTIAYHMEDLSENEKLQLLKNYWISKSNGTVNYENCEVFARHVIDVLAEFMNKSDAVYGDIPLRYQLVAEVMYDKLIEYVTSVSPELPEISSLTPVNLYECYFQLNYVNYMRTSTETEDEDEDEKKPDIYEILYDLARHSVCGSYEAVADGSSNNVYGSPAPKRRGFRATLCNLFGRKKSPAVTKYTVPEKTKFNEDVQALKMICKSKIGQYRFVHKSFASFVLAQYLLNNLQNEENTILLMKLLSDHFEKFRNEIVNDIMEKNPNLAQDFIISLTPKQIEEYQTGILMASGMRGNIFILNVFFESMKADEVNTIISDIKYFTISKPNVKLLHFLIDWVKFKSLDKQCIRKFINSEDLLVFMWNNNENFKTTRSATLDIIIEYMQYLLDENFLTAEVLEHVYLSEFKESGILVDSIKNDSFTVAKPLLDFFADKIGTVFITEIITKKDNYGKCNCLLTMASQYDDYSKVELLNTQSNELLKWLKELKIPIDYKLQLLYERCYESHMTVLEVLSVTDEHGQIEMFKKLLEFNKKLHQEKYDDDNTARQKQLMKTFKYLLYFTKSQILLEIFLDWLKLTLDNDCIFNLLMISDDTGLLPIQYHAMRCNIMQLRCLLNFVLAEFDDEQCQKLIGFTEREHLNNLRKIKENMTNVVIAILKSVEKLNNSDDFQKIIVEQSVTFNGEEILKNNNGVLIQAIKFSKTIVDFYLTKMRQFECLESTLPKSLHIVQLDVEPDLDILFDAVKDQDVTLIKTFLWRRIDNFNILEQTFLSNLNCFSEIYADKIFHLLEIHADADIMLKIIQPKNENEPSIILNVLSNAQMLGKLLNLIKAKNVDKKSLMTVIMDSDKANYCQNTVFEMLEFSGEENTKIFHTFIKEYFTKPEIATMLKQCAPAIKKKHTSLLK